MTQSIPPDMGRLLGRVMQAQGLTEAGPDILFKSLPDAACEYASPRFCTYAGLSAAQAAGHGWLGAIAAEDREQVTDALRHAGQSGEPFDEECRISAADGERRWFLLRGRCLPGRGSRKPKWFCFLSDIDDIKQAAGALRELTGQLLRAQDDERRRIARELHDSTAQNLAAATFNIIRATQGTSDLAPNVGGLLEEARRLIEQSQEELRTLSYLLHPPMLDEAGLPSALRMYIEGFTQRSGVDVRLTIGPELSERRLSLDVETALFRVVQEGLNNVHRHSGSHTASIAISLVSRGPASHSQLFLEVADTGSGMRRHDVLSGRRIAKPGTGLSSMRGRVDQLGGELQVQSDEHGTKIMVWVPLESS